MFVTNKKHSEVVQDLQRRDSTWRASDQRQRIKYLSELSLLTRYIVELTGREWGTYDELISDLKIREEENVRQEALARTEIKEIPAK